MTTLEQYNKMMNQVGTEVNELEYIDHVIFENNEYYFVIIHLNGNERLEKVK
jgi:NACalpha-BTF3-like transcription factor